MGTNGSEGEGKQSERERERERKKERKTVRGRHNEKRGGRVMKGEKVGKKVQRKIPVFITTWVLFS